MDDLPIEDIMRLRMLVFFTNGLNHKSNLIANFFKNTLLSNSSYMLVNVNSILKRYDMKYIDLFFMNKNYIRNSIKSYNNGPDWRSSSIKELLSLREGQHVCELNKTEICEILTHISTFR